MLVPKRWLGLAALLLSVLALSTGCSTGAAAQDVWPAGRRPPRRARPRASTPRPPPACCAAVPDGFLYIVGGLDAERRHAGRDLLWRATPGSGPSPRSCPARRWPPAASPERYGEHRSPSSRLIYDAARDRPGGSSRSPGEDDIAKEDVGKGFGRVDAACAGEAEYPQSGLDLLAGQDPGRPARATSTRSFTPGDDTDEDAPRQRPPTRHAASRRSVWSRRCEDGAARAAASGKARGSLLHPRPERGPRPATPALFVEHTYRGAPPKQAPRPVRPHRR